MSNPTRSVFGASLVCLIMLAFLITSGVSLRARGGGWSGTGTGGSAASFDLYNPWFLGPEPIPYCLIKSDRIGLSQPALHMMIRKSSEKWQQFFERYNITDSLLEDKSYSFPDGVDRTISLQLTQSSDCGAVERFCHPSHTDSEACHQALTSKILILFGAPNEVVKPFLSLATRVDGASIRTAYDHKNYRSGGIVWINELKGGGWSQYQHMLLHEMGHTFGMKHDSCWVMTKDVADFATGWNGLGDVGEIEATNWPYSFKKDDQLLFTDQKLAFDGSTTGYYPTRYFLPGLWDKFGFAEAGAFRLIGEVGDANAQGIRLKLVFEEEKSGKKIEMSGSLIEKSYSFEFPLIPSLFTSWIKILEPSKSITKHRFFMNGWVSDNLQGALAWNQQEVPVTLERKKGMILSLYFPEIKRWTTFTTIRSNSQGLTVQGAKQ